MVPGAGLVVKGKVEDGMTMKEREREREGKKKGNVEKELEPREEETSE